MPAEVWFGLVAASFIALLISVLGVGVSAFKPFRRWPTGVGSIFFACLLFAYCTGGLSAAQHYRRGLAAQGAGNPEAALHEFSAAGKYADAGEQAAKLQQTVDHLRADYVQAEAAIKRRDWTEAEMVLNPLVLHYPHFRAAAQLRERVDREVTRQNLAAAVTVAASTVSASAVLPSASASAAAADASPPASATAAAAVTALPASATTAVADTSLPANVAISSSQVLAALSAAMALLTPPRAAVTQPFHIPDASSNADPVAPVAPGAVPLETPPAGTTPAESPPPTTAADVLALFQERGLPIASYSTDPSITDPDHQLGKAGRFTSRGSFLDSQLAAADAPLVLTNGGAVEFFTNAGDATRRFQELARIKAVISDAAEYDYQNGPILLRLSPRFSADQAQRYYAVLLALPGTAP